MACAVLLRLSGVWTPPPVVDEELFPRSVIGVPLFVQYDDRWANERMGRSGSRIGEEGCAISAVAMLFRYYGIEVDPKVLNTFLSENEGYTDRGWIHWAKAAEFCRGQVEFVYCGPASTKVIDRHLNERNPVIVKTFIDGLTPHWVLIVGKEGDEYLINDPLAREPLGVRRLSDYGNDIDALRVYRVKRAVSSGSERDANTYEMTPVQSGLINLNEEIGCGGEM